MSKSAALMLAIADMQQMTDAHAATLYCIVAFKTQRQVSLRPRCESLNRNLCPSFAERRATARAMPSRDRRCIFVAALSVEILKHEQHCQSQGQTRGHPLTLNMRPMPARIMVSTSMRSPPSSAFLTGRL